MLSTPTAPFGFLFLCVIESVYACVESVQINSLNSSLFALVCCISLANTSVSVSILVIMAECEVYTSYFEKNVVLAPKVWKITHGLLNFQKFHFDPQNCENIWLIYICNVNVWVL